MKRATKITACTALGLSLLIATTYRNIAYNVMSHHPIDMTSSEILKSLPNLMFTKGWYDGIPDNADCVPKGTDLNAIYLGKQNNPFPLSLYAPQDAKIPQDVKLYDPSCVIDFGFGVESLDYTFFGMLEQIKEMKKGDIIPLKEEGDQYHPYYWHYGEGLIQMKRGEPIEGFGNFTLSIGYDEKGKYLSFFDIFDFQIGIGGYFNKSENSLDNIGSTILSKIGEPIYFYKRWYFEDVGITDEVLEQKLLEKKREYQ